MDPRLNPNLSPSQPAQLMQDIRPGGGPSVEVIPASAPAPPTPAPVQPPIIMAAAPTPAPPPPAAAPASPFTAEIVDPIPMGQPGQPAPHVAPQVAAPAIQMPSHDAPPKAEEDDLDKILQAVNNRVSAPQAAPSKSKKLPSIPKFGVGGEKLKNIVKSPKAVAPIAVALIVAIMLSVTAVIAYRQGTHTKISGQAGLVGTSSASSAAIQQAGGVLVRPNDLDDFSQELQSKLSSLNDSQDFSSQALTDQVLGL